MFNFDLPSTTDIVYLMKVVTIFSTVTVGPTRHFS